MAATCVIFDVDGTLLQSSLFEDYLYIAAVRSLLGDVLIRRNWGEYDHVTDLGILREICAENRVPPGDCEDHIRSRFGALMSDHLNRFGPCAPIPGAIQFLNELRASPDFQIGIATGGWGHIARMKLSGAGYDLTGIPVASSDNGFERIRVMDAEWDQRASEQLHWRFIGVGSRLHGRCSPWIPDFLEPGLIQSLFG